jgi:TetR/AcrR family transcriptional regulator of autoinduction and epiphytic fitness
VGDDDGRRQRRERNRDAVVDALLAIVADGDLAPSADAVAARAGLSTRSLFRYFDAVDDLCRAAIARQHERVAALLELPPVADGTLGARARDIVEHRVDLFDAMGDVGRLARLRAPFQPLIANALNRVRRLLRQRMATVLAAELDALGPASSAALDAADVLCSFEAYRLLRDELGRDRDAAVDAMVLGIGALVSSNAVASR